MAQNIDPKQVLDHFLKVLTKQFACFDGRMSKMDYMLFMIPALVLKYLLVFICIGLVLLIPIFGATARRFHDLGITGWASALMLVPVVDILVLVYLCMQDGQAEANQFGEVPASTFGSSTPAE